jgi:hypothetical protein
MFMMHVPETFKVGDSADCRINEVARDLEHVALQMKSFGAPHM